MMDWTDRHCRYFLRQISQQTLLYTEMITTGALLHQPPARFLDYHPAEHPVALQLGGSEPDALAQCTRLAQDWGYDEVNLNVGCPSDRVQNGRFGACLMAEPELVADCVVAMNEAGALPVTVKHRIGIDDLDSYDELVRFVEQVSQAGCRTFIVHARKAWLKGLSPKENREVPPLRYDVVHRLKQDFPALQFVINGGVKTISAIRQQLQHVDGVMVGREAYSNPWLLATADAEIFGSATQAKTRAEVVHGMLPYIAARLDEGVPLNRMTRHMLGLYQGQPRARSWRRHLSQQAHLPGAGTEVVEKALALVS
jgi:tRNA-dihydrouridine synthase A